MNYFNFIFIRFIHFIILLYNVYNKIMELYNDDCFEILPEIKDGSVDLVVVDLPYTTKGQKATACKWDTPIDLERMWKELKRCCKRDCVYVFFCTTKFGYKLIQSNERWFRYDLVWEKSRKVGFLSANKMPLRKHEMMYVFKEQQGTYNPQKTEGKPYTANRKNEKMKIYNNGKEMKRTDTDNKGDRHPSSILNIPEAPEDQEERKHQMMYIFSDDGVDIDNSRNLGLRAYAKQVKEYINKNIKEIDKAVGNQGIHHFYSFTSTQFSLPTEKTYNKLIEVYELDKMEGFRTLEDLKNEWGEPTYNPQKTEGKPYKQIQGKQTETYGIENTDRVITENKGDRHPTTIVKFNNPKKSLHRTQKPVALCEWLIKSYSNQGDLVLDFTMGSGSTGVACKNTNRKFIGIEKDEEIFKTAYERLMD